MIIVGVQNSPLSWEATEKYLVYAQANLTLPLSNPINLKPNNFTILLIFCPLVSMLVAAK